MDPISSVSSLQHCLAVFLHSFFFGSLFFCTLLSARLLLSFVLFFHFHLWFCSPRAHFQLTPSVSHSHVRRSRQKAQDPLPCIKRTIDFHRLNIPRTVSATPATPVGSVWTNGTMTVPHGSASSEGRDHKNLLYTQAQELHWLVIYTEKESCMITSCLLQSRHTALTLSFNGKTNKKGGPGISRQTGTVAKSDFAPFKTFKCLFEALCPSSLSCSNFPVLWGKRKPCHKRGIRAYFQWMSQHVEMGKALQTVCITKAIINI